MKRCNRCYTNEAQLGRNVCRSCRHREFVGRRQTAHKTVDDGLKILMIDIETSPNIVFAWDIWNQNIGINQIIKPVEMLCFAAKWYGQDEPTRFYSNWEHGQESMVNFAYLLLNDADMVVHFYGSRFDVPHLNREFLLHGMTPPRPYKQVDLKFTVGRQFKFTSNKLQFVSEVLGLEGKVEHEGFPLWDKVLNILDEYPPAIEQDAKERMQVYNERDVTLLEEVYEVLLPWIPNHPHRHLYGGNGCPTCGAEEFVDAGYAFTKLSKFRQYQCQSCKSYFRDSKRINGVKIQESVR